MEVKLFSGTRGMILEEEMNKFISENAKKVIALSQSGVVWPFITDADGKVTEYVITTTITLVFEPKINKNNLK